MTIEFKIGQFYRTRGGKKVHLFGIRQDGELYFECDGDTFTTYKTGVRYQTRDARPNDYDIVSEWREPHRHESVVWVGENPACYGNALVSSFFGFTINEVTSKKTDVCNRKFRVICEEILE